MDILHDLIRNLNSKEIKMIRNKLQAMQSGNKYTQLFDYLVANDECDDIKISKKIYGEPRTAGYYKLWSRLAEKVEESLMNQLNSSYDSMDGRISAILSLSQHQFRRNSFVPAIEFANRAEKLALDSHHYQLLDIIYNLKLSHADRLTEDIDLLLKRWRHNQQQLVLMGELNAAFARIRIELRDLKIRGSHFELGGTIKKILAEFKFTSHRILRNPMSALRVVELCRSVIISAKEYGKFKPFLIRIYNYLQRNNLLNETNKIIERDFLYMITHTLYRSKDFEGASKFLKELEASLDFAGEIFDPLIGKAISLKAAILFCQGRVEESIVILKRTLDNKIIRIDPKEKLNMEVNLGVYYFFSKKYVECNHYIQRLPLKSASTKELLSQEWFFKKDLIEVIVQSELEKVDIAHQRLRAVRRDYDELLAEPNYKRAGEFINLIEIYFQSPEKIRTPEFIAQVEKIRSGWHNQAEDIQALMFFSWYRSKMLGCDCYELFLERIRSNMEEILEE